MKSRKRERMLERLPQHSWSAFVLALLADQPRDEQPTSQVSAALNGSATAALGMCCALFSNTELK